MISLQLGAGPGRNAMSPPELARDAPVVDVVHPVQIDRAVVLRNDRDLAAFNGCRARSASGLNLDEPLRRQPRLDDRSATVALADRKLRGPFRQPEILVPADREHALAGFEAVKSRVWTSVLVHVRVLVHHVDLRQVVAHASLEVVGIVRGRDFDRSSAELRLREFVGDDRNLTIHQRQQNFLAVQMRVTLVLSVDRDRGIAEHRFRTGGRNRDELVRFR